MALCALTDRTALLSVQKDFLAQTGDPTESGSGGESVWAKLPASSPAASTSRYFVPERKSSLKHKAKGTVSLACTALSKDEDADKVAGSQFFITLGSDLDYLDGQHAPFGQVVEGQEPGGTLDKINSAFTDESGRPLQDIRIRHIEILGELKSLRGSSVSGSDVDVRSQMTRSQTRKAL